MMFVNVCLLFLAQKIMEHSTIMLGRRLLLLAAVLPLLAGCNEKPEAMEPAPIRELSGKWQPINLARDCSESFIVFGPRAIWRLQRNLPPEKLAILHRVTISPDFAELLVTSLPTEMKLSLGLDLKDNKVVLKTTKTSSGADLSTSLDKQDAEVRDILKRENRITSTMLDLKRCEGP